MFSLTIDARETKIINKLKDFDLEKINLNIKQLHLGDFVYYNKFNDTVLFIERKTWKDMADSIVDGRYREQIIRYTSTGITTIYLLEGTEETYEQVHKIPNSTIYSTMLSILIRDRIPIIQTKNINDSIQWILRIYFKLIKLEKIAKIPVIDLYLSSMMSNKKENLTPELCFQNQLRQIPGISTKIAKIIYSKYPNFPKLIKSYEEIDEKDRPKFLANISTGKRRLGPKLSTKIYNFIFNK